MKAEAIQSDLLKAAGIAHGFFTRRGGVSEGVYDRSTAASARRTIPARVTKPPPHGRSARHRQRSSAGAVPGPFHHRLAGRCAFAQEERPSATGSSPQHADSTWRYRRRLRHHSLRRRRASDHRRGPRRLEGRPDRRARSHHDAMETKGARRDAISAALGPTIGPELLRSRPGVFRALSDASQDYANFFKPSARAGHFMFDLPRFIGARVKSAGICQFESCGVDTYADEARCFSYRRSVHRNEPDYGRLIAAIALV